MDEIGVFGIEADLDEELPHEVVIEEVKEFEEVHKEDDNVLVVKHSFLSVHLRVKGDITSFVSWDASVQLRVKPTEEPRHVVTEVGSRLNAVKRRKNGEEPKLGGSGGVVRVVALLVFEFIKFPKRRGSDAVVGLGICACLVTGLEHARSLLPSAKRMVLKLARPPAIHTRRGVGLGTGGLLHELDGGAVGAPGLVSR